MIRIQVLYPAFRKNARGCWLRLGGRQNLSQLCGFFFSRNRHGEGTGIVANDAFHCHSLLDVGDKGLANVVDVHQLVDSVLNGFCTVPISVLCSLNPAGGQGRTDVGQTADAAVAACP